MADTHRTAAYATLTDAIQGLTRRGFTESFRIADGGLRTVATREALRAEDLTIREYHRFEGISDPDDMAIIYALETERISGRIQPSSERLRVLRYGPRWRWGLLPHSPDASAITT